MGAEDKLGGLQYEEPASLTAIVFDDMEQGPSLLEATKELQKQEFVNFEDAVAVVKDEEGKVKIIETADKTKRAGTLAGGTLGLMVGFMVGGPIGGLAVGAVGGRLAGKKADVGVDNEFIQEVTDTLKPGTSAGFFLVKSVKNRRAIRAVLARYNGTIYQTTIDESVAEELQKLLSK